MRREQSEKQRESLACEGRRGLTEENMNSTPIAALFPRREHRDSKG